MQGQDADRRFRNKSVRKILMAAEEEFAERGFDGARIDDIAERAGVNKSHIYYHFEGKDQLLEDLASLRLAEMLEEKASLLECIGSLDAEAISRVLKGAIWKILSSRILFLRILVAESLKENSAAPFLFKFVHALVADALGRFESMGKSFNALEFSTSIYYFGILPIAMHLAIGAKWAAFNKSDPARIDEVFLGALEGIYGHYLGGAASKPPEAPTKSPPSNRRGTK
jgi:AcrR family transcriptional regulator